MSYLRKEMIGGHICYYYTETKRIEGKLTTVQ